MWTRIHSVVVGGAARRREPRFVYVVNTFLRNFIRTKFRGVRVEICKQCSGFELLDAEYRIVSEHLASAMHLVYWFCPHRNTRTCMYKVVYDARRSCA